MGTQAAAENRMIGHILSIFGRLSREIYSVEMLNVRI